MVTPKKLTFLTGAFWAGALAKRAHLRTWFYPALVWLALVFPLRAATTIQFAQTSSSIFASENAGTVDLRVQRTGDLETVVQVEYASTNGTALAGVRYTAVSGTLTFLAGETNQTIRVPILNDGLVQGNPQRFRVLLENPSDGAVLGTRRSATIEIYDNDRGVHFDLDTYWVREDCGVAVIPILRDSFAGLEAYPPATLDYATTDVSAKSGVEYQGGTDTLTFDANETTKFLRFPIANDGAKSPRKSFRITLKSSAPGVLGVPSTALVNILDNDPGVQFQRNRYWVRETDSTIDLQLVRGNDLDLKPFTVKYSTGDLTATHGQHYTAAQGTVSFGAGESFRSLSIPIIGPVGGADLRFTVTLTNPSDAVPLGTNASTTVTILDTSGSRAHFFESISAAPNRSIEFVLNGAVHQRFRPYYDFYRIEASGDLVTWHPLAFLQRTNALSNLVSFTDSGLERGKFYRVITNHWISPFPRPDGPFAAGIFSRLLTDPSRRNRYGIDTNSSFMISVWYPAMVRAGASLQPYLHLRPHDDADLANFRDRVPYLVTHALQDAPALTNQAPFPIVLFSPGWTALRSGFAEKGPLLASHGYVAVAVDHADAAVTVFPDGRILYGEPILSDAVFEGRVTDLKFILEQLTQWNNSDPILAGRLGLSSVAAIGHSWGGGVAAELGRMDDRVKAVVLFDAYMQNAWEVSEHGLAKPFLGMYTTEGGGIDIPYALPETKTAIWFIISPSFHGQLEDHYWSNFSSDLAGGREIARTLNDFTLWFLNKYLRNQDEPMPPRSNYRRITAFKQK